MLKSSGHSGGAGVGFVLAVAINKPLTDLDVLLSPSGRWGYLLSSNNGGTENKKYLFFVHILWVGIPGCFVFGVEVVTETRYSFL